VDHLKEWLQRLIGNLDGGDHVVYHDGTDQATETTERIGFPLQAEANERDYLGCTAQLAPDEYDLRKVWRLVEEAPEKNVIFITDCVYLSHFARFYLARLQKENPTPDILPGDAVVITDDGVLHHLSPRD
jgi:hypothetical protein